MNKLIVLIAGKKQSGKNTLANQIAAMFLNSRHKAHYASVNDRGELVVDDRPFGRVDEVPGHVIDIGPGGFEQERFYGARDVRILSFADLLKQFCVNVLGLRKEACYGTDADKNRLTHLRWDGLPLMVRLKYRTRWWHWPRSGRMTGREVMQVFGTDIIRRWYEQAWSESAIREALASPQPLVVMPDTRFPNEINAGKAVFDPAHGIWVRTVRLKRCAASGSDQHASETALDDFCDAAFDAVFPKDLTVTGQEELARELIYPWLTESGLIEPAAHHV